MYSFTSLISFRPLTICISIPKFAVNPDGDLITQNGYLLVNNLCALAGYYCAAYVIDKPRVGRKKLQAYSNIACMIIFLVAGGIFNSAGPSVLMFLYFLSSFTVNFGPNVTTYVMAAETYPTELRATLHGSKYFSFFFLTDSPLAHLQLSLLLFCSICISGQVRCIAGHNLLQIPNCSPDILCLRSYLFPWITRLSFFLCRSYRRISCRA